MQDVNGANLQEKFSITYGLPTWAGTYCGIFNLEESNRDTRFLCGHTRYKVIPPFLTLLIPIL
jgi:hypothetical protein